MRWFAVLCACSAMVRAQAPAASVVPEVLQLSQARYHALSNLARQPNYTCLETIERSRRAGAGRKFKLIDTLRLEVALVDGKEMFGWPGAKRFEDTELRNIVTTGAIGNGNFALHARAIFEGSAPRFDYRGHDPLDGRDTARYDYRVPLLGSGYKLRANDREAIVGYHGSVWIDPQSLDLARLEVIADDIPVNLGIAYASDRMDYARIRIGEGEFLLPASSELNMIDLNGSASRNQVRFSNCREFTGESVLSFGDADPAAAPAPVAEIALPDSLGITLRLLDDVDATQAAIGDPVRARLENDLKQEGRVLFSKGATALGRITRLERRDDFTEFGLEFSEIEAAGAHARMHASLEQVMGIDPLGPPRRRVLAQARPGEGLIALGLGRLRLRRGILMFWRTDKRDSPLE